MNKPVKPAVVKKNEPGPLRVGFVPLNDCAPFAVARELGLFAKYGLQVELRRELGWATIRDKIIHGELDAAHALAGMPVAAAFGLGSVRCECVSGLVLSLHGNAITLSTALWESGVRDAVTLREQIRKTRAEKIYTFGIVFSFSSHNFLLRQWLASGGIDPDRDVRIVVVPPAQMVANLKSSNLDGYCVGEPWNSLAVHRRIGWCAAISAELAPGHPEKILITRRKFAEERGPEHLALIASLIEACAFCDRPENTHEVARILAQPHYLNLPAEMLSRSLRGWCDLGGGRVEAMPDFQIFHRNEANEPTQEKIAWIVRSILQSGLLPERSVVQTAAVREIFQPDIFHKAQRLFGKFPPHENNPESEANLIST
jgi:ABC-type nitrate/sulfonate/bicarbonate transport system substrate-binding protein